MRNPLLATATQDFYLRNVHLAAEEDPIGTYVAAEEAHKRLKNVAPETITQFDQLVAVLAEKIRFISSHEAINKILRVSVPVNAAG
jgi:predicted glycoside hydrolase/deacetylase ChbG (UPF0249 family)